MTASDMDSAKQLVDAVNGLIAMGQLAANQDPTLQMLLSGLTVSQDINRISLDFNFSADLLEMLDQAAKMAKPMAAM